MAGVALRTGSGRKKNHLIGEFCKKLKCVEYFRGTPNAHHVEQPASFDSL